MRQNQTFREMLKKCLRLLGIYVNKKHIYNLVRVIIYCLDKSLEVGDCIQLDEVIIKKKEKYITITSSDKCEFPKEIDMTDKRNIKYFNKLFGKFIKDKTNEP